MESAAADAEVPEGMDIPAELEQREDQLKAITEAKAKMEARATELHAAEQAEHEAKLAQGEARPTEAGKRPGGNAAATVPIERAAERRDQTDRRGIAKIASTLGKLHRDVIEQ